MFHFLFFFRTHVGWHTRAGTGSHPSSSLSIRSLKNYVTYPDKVAHLFKIKNCIILDPTTVASTRCDLVETNCTCNVTNAHTHTRMHACIRNEIYSLSLLSPLNLLYIPTLYPFSLSKYYHKVYFSIFRTAHVAGDTTVSSWSWNEARVSTWWTSSIGRCKPWQMETTRCCAASLLDYLLWTRAPALAPVERYSPRRCNFRNADRTHGVPRASSPVPPDRYWRSPPDRRRSWSSGSYGTRINRRASP